MRRSCAAAGRSAQFASVLPLVASQSMKRSARNGASSARNCGQEDVRSCRSRSPGIRCGCRSPSAPGPFVIVERQEVAERAGRAGDLAACPAARRSTVCQAPVERRRCRRPRACPSPLYEILYVPVGKTKPMSVSLVPRRARDRIAVRVLLRGGGVEGVASWCVMSTHGRSPETFTPSHDDAVGGPSGASMLGASSPEVGAGEWPQPIAIHAIAKIPPRIMPEHKPNGATTIELDAGLSAARRSRATPSPR